MENRIVFENNQVASKYFDSKTNTITIKDEENTSFYFDFVNYVPETLNLVLINSKITLIENYKSVSKSNYKITIDENSSLNRLSILVDNGDIDITRDVDNYGYYKSMQIDLSSSNLKSNENINMLHENAYSLIIDGIYAYDKASKKYQTNLNHISKDSTSKAQIFAINDNEAHVSIYTDAYIKNKATNVNTNQEGRIINLTDTCSGIVLPNLHIDENDVVVSHSCSVGSVNKDHLYYLQTRGFSKEQATKILIRGYFNPLLKNIENENLYNELEKVLEQRIG